MKVVAFLPAKGTSQRIVSKNLKLLNGKPLFLHTLEKLCDCDFIDEVYLDSESDEVLQYADYLNYIPLKRDPALATNKTDGHQMFYNEVKQVDADIYVQILGTSPFIKKETIKKGIDILTSDGPYDSVVLVKRDKQYLWEDGNPVYDKAHIPNSVDLPDTIIETMGLYVTKREAAHRNKQRFGDKVYMLEAEPIEAVDINYPKDFEFAEYIARGQTYADTSKLNSIKSHLSSAMISDILSEYGINNSIIGLVTNFNDRKMFGRANTLKIRRLEKGEDFNGIYKGLETYKSVRYGDIIVVENEASDYAYFGELNANLAVRAGAVGTIIGGKTRDIKDVTNLEYSVYSTGYCCSDVKYRATVESHNKPVTLQGVRICPSDLIFADVNGIVVIPRNLEKEVMVKAIKTIEKENDVKLNIMKGFSEREIFDNSDGGF